MSRTPVQKRSQAQEQRLAKAGGGKVQKASGAGWVHKNDVKTDRFLIEAKCRLRPDAKSITILLEWLEENEVNAMSVGRDPMLAFELGGRDWFVIPDHVRETLDG